MKQRVWKLPNRILVMSAAVSAGVAVVLATHQDQAHEVWRDVMAVPVSSLVAAALFVICQWSCQTLRLWAVIPQGAALTLGRTAYAFSVGEWLNIFAPARVGDALKVVMINRAAGSSSMSLSRATGAVLADKIVDAGSLIIICAATGLLGLVGGGARANLPAPWLALGAGAVLVLLLLGIRVGPPAWLAWLIRLRREVVTGLSALTHPIKLLGSISFSVGAWTAEVLAVRALCGGLGFSVSFPKLVLALAVLNVAISVPVSVANVGVYEAGLAFGLGQAGIPLPSAVAIATLHHALELLGTHLGAAGTWLGVRTRGKTGSVPDPRPAISDSADSFRGSP